MSARTLERERPERSLYRELNTKKAALREEVALNRSRVQITVVCECGLEDAPARSR